MEMSTLWWIFAGVAVVAELLTGTLYLLMVAAGMVAGALAAHAGTSSTVQIAAAAIVGLIATAAWHFLKKKKDPSITANANTDVNQDVGATVHVGHWKQDGTAQVNYRGANWAVQAAPGVTQHAGSYRVVAMSGTRLVVEPV